VTSFALDLTPLKGSKLKTLFAAGALGLGIVATSLPSGAYGEPGALGQNPEPSTADQTAPTFTQEQLDQMLAPIALYPDPLLAQILMAATYPLEVVEADRWIQDPKHAELDGDRLIAVLEQEPWDPSVKSLVPFPQILKMMDLNLEWTANLGEAFLADQAGVMDSIQRLRQEAKMAGKLSSTPQQIVTTEGAGQPITIEPLSPETVYVPNYSPSDVYGTWPYPAYPPSSFPGYVGSDVVVAVLAPLCGWHHWDWVHHRIEIDRERFAVLNRNHLPIGGVTWEHDPFHHQGVSYRDPAVRDRFDGHNATSQIRVLRSHPTIATPEVRSPPPAVEQLQVSKPGSSLHVRSSPGVTVLRGHPTIATPEVRSFAPAGGQPQVSKPASILHVPSSPEVRVFGSHPTIATPEVRLPSTAVGQPQVSRPASNLHGPSTFESAGLGIDARMGRQATMGRVAPVGRTLTRPAINTGGGRVLPYGQPK
jgi:hypothetical protein